MAGLFFSRKSKNGADAPPAVAPDAQTVYEPLPPLVDEPPDALPGVPDLYAVLGVDPRSSDDIIRYAYRKKAAKLLDARWRPGRAARRLAELNAAYEILGKPDRRADYDRQRARIYYYQQAASQQSAYHQSGYQQSSYQQSSYQQSAQDTLRGDEGLLGTSPMPATKPRRSSTGTRRRAPRGLIEAIAIVGVVVIAAYAGYIVVGNWSHIDLGRLQDAGAAAGLPIRARATPAPTASPVPFSTPAPRQVVVPPVVVPTTPTAAPTVTPEPPKPKPGTPAQGTARMSNQSPPRRSDVSVMAHLTRDGQPLAGVPVYIVAHYKTVEERFPPGDGVEATNEGGDATVSFNVGDATAGFLVTVDVIATVDGEQVKLQTSFVPR
jgi:hypothetical protein